MNIQGKDKFAEFLNEVLPENIPVSAEFEHINTRDAFIKDVIEGIDAAPKSIRLTPHIMSLINWNKPLDDPMRRQFIPMKSALLPDHPQLSLNSLHESLDSPVLGLVHRYPDKALFLGQSHPSSSTLLILMPDTNLKQLPSVRFIAGSALAHTQLAPTPSPSRKRP
jgi:lysine 2,3-aminomutase